MTNEVTGERFVPEAMGGQLIEAEHVVRYALAAQLAQGRRVLDAGCGVGWGTGVLVAAGASAAIGLDLDPGAIADARQRVPDADFVQGDIVRLPWDAGSFGLVVCFETLEHVAEHEQALDELVRVLAPDGVLLVSSPNPRVYPAGNPFHLHEFTPEELEAAVARRLADVTQWNQHTQIASVLLRRGSLPPGETHEVLAQTVAALESGSDPYSLIIAGHGSAPSLPPLVGCAPCDQLFHLEALGARLSDERERMAEDQKRVVAEREQILAEREKMLLEIREQQTTISAFGERIEALRREREHTAALLLESEQQLAAVLASAADQLRHQEQVDAALTEQVAQLQHEVSVFRTSKSWRLTAPLRNARRRL